MKNNWTKKSAKKFLEKNWNNHMSSISYTGIGKIYDYFNGVLSPLEIEDVLVKFESYSLLRQQKKSRNLGFSFPYHLNNLMETDSFEISELSEENDGYKHVLCAVNIFSKRAYAVPMKIRDSETGLNALHIIFTSKGTYPEYLISDNGGECTSKLITKYLLSKNITPIVAEGSHKASSVEVFQRTLQRKIYTYLDDKQTRKWLDALSHIILNYNLTKHSSTGFTPIEIEDSRLIQQKVQEKYLDRFTEFRLKKLRRSRKPKYKIGDVVRIHFKKTKFSRSYDQQTGPQRYIIWKIVNKRAIPEYFLKEEDGDHLTGGSFLENEIIRVDLGQIYRQFVRKQITKKGKLYNVMGIPGYPEKYDWHDAV